MEATWPVTKAKYPPREEQRSWLKHEELAETYACVVKLGGRQTKERTGRAPGRLVVKGMNVDECFVALLRKSRRAFKGNALIEFPHRTVPKFNAAATAQQQPATAIASVIVSAVVVVVAAVEAATRSVS